MIFRRSILSMSLCGFVILFALWTHGCLVEEKCFQNADCDSPKICDADGECVYECDNSGDCSEGFTCENHECVPGASSEEPLDCPEGMASIADAYCMDVYEASRPDATANNPGEDGSSANSMEGVLPWRVTDNDEGRAACEAAGKSLCTSDQWRFACRGSNDLNYAYGNSYDPDICNGLDTFGLGSQHLLPTGSFSECVNAWGVYDLNGNLWEHTKGGDDTKVRGGAYNCSDSRTFHRCDYIPQTWTPSALGFRCCLIPDASTEETGDAP